MRAIKLFWSNTDAAEVTELAIVLAIVVAGCVVALAAIGDKVQQLYTQVEGVLP